MTTSTTGKHPYMDHVPHGLAKFGVEDSEIAVAVIKRWLDTCEDTHTDCQASRGKFSPGLPTRLIELQGSRVLRLRTMDTEDEKVQYACLSHCWGDMVPLRTTSKTIQSFHDTGIPREMLPLTFQHAVDMTNRLGLKYI
jgi:hypothetical protein